MTEPNRKKELPLESFNPDTTEGQSVSVRSSTNFYTYDVLKTKDSEQNLYDPRLSIDWITHINNGTDVSDK